MSPHFLFATGIENSNPIIEGGRTRMDELEKCGHYRFWQRDFELVQELGIRFLRYGQVPIVMPEDCNDAWVQKQQTEARQTAAGPATVAANQAAPSSV